MCSKENTPYRVVSTITLWLLAVGAASAYQDNQIYQVIAGVNGNTTIQAIELRMGSFNQNNLGPLRLVVRDAAGLNPVVVRDFSVGVANHGPDTRVLVATSNISTVTSPSLTPDFTIAPANRIPDSYLAAGTLTLESDPTAVPPNVVYWRFSWGGASYTGPGNGDTFNDPDGNFNPPYSGPLPSADSRAVEFTSDDPTQNSTNNANDYALSTCAAILTKNNGNNAVLVESAGACCIGEGACEARTCTDCTNAGGEFFGENSECAPNACDKFIAPGIDLFMTPPGHGEVREFDPSVGGTPIPSGFFGSCAGFPSDSFDGRITLKGDPFGLGNFAIFPADTVIKRIEPMVFPTCPDTETIEIEIIGLSLVSVSPIAITYGGGACTELWDVRVCLSSISPQPIGHMTATQACPDGGTFTSEVPVLPKLIFTKVSDGPSYTLEGSSVITLSTSCPMGWVKTPDPDFFVITAPPGLVIDGDCDGIGNPPMPGTGGFFAGITPSPCDCGSPATGQSKRLNWHEALWASHGIIVAQQEYGDVDGDGIFNDADNCPGIPNPDQRDCDCDLTGDACQGPDCNANATPDNCDIATGVSQDSDSNSIPDECQAPFATITGAVSRRGCDLSLMPGLVSDPRQGGVSQVRVSFDVAPGGPGVNPVTVERATCAEPAFAPYSGASVVSAHNEGNDLVLNFNPGLENGRTYRLSLGADVTSTAGQTVEVRGLVGDANSDGIVNATDRSLVVGAWTGSGFTCATDFNNDGVTNATDRSVAVGAWTGSENCAPEGYACPGSLALLNPPPGQVLSAGKEATIVARLDVPLEPIPVDLLTATIEAIGTNGMRFPIASGDLRSLSYTNVIEADWDPVHVPSGPYQISITVAVAGCPPLQVSSLAVLNHPPVVDVQMLDCQMLADGSLVTFGAFPTDPEGDEVRDFIWYPGDGSPPEQVVDTPTFSHFYDYDTSPFVAWLLSTDERGASTFTARDFDSTVCTLQATTDCGCESMTVTSAAAAAGPGKFCAQNEEAFQFVSTHYGATRVADPPEGTCPRGEVAFTMPTGPVLPTAGNRSTKFGWNFQVEATLTKNTNDPQGCPEGQYVRYSTEIRLTGEEAFKPLPNRPVKPWPPEGARTLPLGGGEVFRYEGLADIPPPVVPPRYPKFNDPDGANGPGFGADDYKKDKDTGSKVHPKGKRLWHDTPGVTFDATKADGIKQQYDFLVYVEGTNTCWCRFKVEHQWTAQDGHKSIGGGAPPVKFTKIAGNKCTVD